jgi:hypothetical protein
MLSGLEPEHNPSILYMENSPLLKSQGMVHPVTNQNSLITSWVRIAPTSTSARRDTVTKLICDATFQYHGLGRIRKSLAKKHKDDQDFSCNYNEMQLKN